MEQVYIMLGLIGVVGIGIFAIAWYQEYGTLEHYVPKRWRKRHGD